MQPPPEPFELGRVDPGADAAGVNQFSAGIVIAEQQRAEERPRAFWIRPADRREFLAVQAFDLEPEAAVAGCVGRVGRFETMPSSFIAQACA
jgi:hypothetical protein